MTTQEAKNILSVYRPGAADAHDPEFTEALTLARHDPELKRWLEEHHAVQNALRARFKKIAVPAGLKEQIISEHKARAVVVWWRQPAFLAAAAMVVVLASIAAFRFWPGSAEAEQGTFATYRARMVGAALRNYPMTLETSDANQIRVHLTKQQAPYDYVLPQSLEKTALAGCGVLSWRDQKVAMVCFVTGKPLVPGEKSDLFLFVVSRATVADAPASELPVIARVSKLTTASWSVGDKTYLLATPEDENFVRRMF